MATYRSEEDMSVTGLGVLADVGMYFGSQWASGMERRALKKAVLSPEREALYAARRLASTRGLGVLSSKAWSQASRMGITKQFATIAASRIGAGVFAGLTIAMWAPYVFQGAHGAVSAIKSLGRSSRRQEFGETFNDSYGTYTERQRAVQAITSSRMSVRSALGNEASLFHR